MTADELKAKIAEVDQALQQVVQALMQQNPQANRLQGQRDVYAEMLSALEALPEEKPCSDSSVKDIDAANN